MFAKRPVQICIQSKDGGWMVTTQVPSSKGDVNKIRDILKSKGLTARADSATNCVFVSADHGISA